MTTAATADGGPPRSRIHRHARGLLTQSFALAAAGATIVFAVNHGDALLSADLSTGQALQAGLGFLALAGTLTAVTPAQVVKPGTPLG